MQDPKSANRRLLTLCTTRLMAQRDMHAYNVETLYAVLELNQEKKIKN